MKSLPLTLTLLISSLKGQKVPSVQCAKKKPPMGTPNTYIYIYFPLTNLPQWAKQANISPKPHARKKGFHIQQNVHITKTPFFPFIIYHSRWGTNAGGGGQ